VSLKPDHNLTRAVQIIIIPSDVVHVHVDGTRLSLNCGHQVIYEYGEARWKDTDREKHKNNDKT
jgi:hypothetical protein